MDNPCGTTKANIFESTEINGTPIYFGSGVSPVNSPAQYFVAWGKGVLDGGLIHTYNSKSPEQGAEWFIAVSYTHLRAHETRHDLVCRLLLEKKKNKKQQ